MDQDFTEELYAVIPKSRDPDCDSDDGYDSSEDTGNRQDWDHFDEARRTACECLDACPVDVIRRFFNWSWRFMDAYRTKLTGKAAEWAVWKQKSHQRVGQQAMMSEDAMVIVN